MSEKVNVELGHVQKTMFLPLWGRAVETQKDNPRLVDPAAVEIIQKVDYDFSSLAGRLSPLSQFAWIKRAIFTDRVARDFLKNHPHGTIVNIGCGLDTSFERVDNGSLLWYDLDLPDMIELRKKFIRENERRKFIASSFLEKEWLTQIKVNDGLLLIAAGVFYYFQESQIKDFLCCMADLFPKCEIVLDVCSPYGVKTANKMVIKNSGLDEKSFLTWGIKSPREILNWDRRYKILNTFYYFSDGDVPLRLRLAGSISDWLKIQYMLHLQL
ncbi:MAG: class I SAM-dependent methyltransferase [Anaerolineae bacterium]|nr:class I SAM-dependent methyltransferase [Anaerolineae bacterium]